MTRTTFIASIATLAVVAATPAIAGPGGGHGGGPGVGATGGMHGGAGAGVGAAAGGQGGLSSSGAAIRDSARVQSQGAVNANARAIDRANANSALSGGSTTTTTIKTSEPLTGTRIRSENRVNANAGATSKLGMATTTQLTGVTSGMTVVDSTGTTIGTVTGIRTTGNGSAKSVQVTLTNGQVINLSSSSLSLSGGVLTTNSLTTNVNSQGAAHASINGLIHASPNSALASAGITTLTGLTTGLTVNDSGGTSIGTVSGVLTNRAGAVVAIQVDLSGGGTITIPATTLSMDGTTVVTTASP